MTASIPTPLDQKPELHPDTLISIDRHHLLAALELAPKKDIRPYLNGVHIEVRKDKTTIIGCDGCAIWVSYHPTIIDGYDAFTPFCLTIPRWALEQALKTKSDYLRLKQSGDCFVIGTVVFRPDDYKYPDWRKIIKHEPSPHAPVVVNPDYVTAANKALRRVFTSDANIGMESVSDGNAMIMHAGTDNAMVLIMGIMRKCRRAYTPFAG